MRLVDAVCGMFYDEVGGFGCGLRFRCGGRSVLTGEKASCGCV